MLRTMVRGTRLPGCVALVLVLLAVGCGGGDSADTMSQPATQAWDQDGFTCEKSAMVYERCPVNPKFGSKRPTPPSSGVSYLDYSPKPISKDMTEMTARFTTTGPAPAGLEYSAWLFTGEGDDRDQDCYSEFGPSSGVPGEAGKTYEQVIGLVEDDLHACYGRAVLIVMTQEVGDPGHLVEEVAAHYLDILPAR